MLVPLSFFLFFWVVLLMPFVCSLCTLELFFGVSLFNTRFLFTYQKKKTNKQTFDYLTSKLGMIDIYDPV